MNPLHDLAAAVVGRLEPEAAHAMALAALRAGLGSRARADGFVRLRTQLAGLSFPNPIGLAAGFDKDCRAPDAMLSAGFGFVECGTVTPLAQAGNARPRLFRLRADRAVINRMGFNNGGLSGFADRLARRKPRRGVVGANIGANKDSADRIGDYVRCLGAVWRDASYVALNVSSPNTPGLRGLQERGALTDLLGAISEARARLSTAHGERPVFLKLAPDLDDAAIAAITECAITAHVTGLIVSNTTIARDMHLVDARKDEPGGLSGAPLLERSTRVLRSFAQAGSGRLALIGCGGVASGADALAKIKAGASAVQLYTALVYHGPGLVARILSDLDARLAAEGFAHVGAAIGADV